MKKGFWFIALALVLLLTISCQDSSNPLPTLESISQSSRVINMPSFILTVKGSNFVKGSEIFFNGIAKNTDYKGSQELSAEITTEDINEAFASSASGLSNPIEVTIPIFIKNPLPGGGNSDSLQFTIRDKFTFQNPIKISDLKLTVFDIKAYYDKYETLHCAWQVKNDTTLWFAYTQTKSKGEQFTTIQYLQNLTLSESTGNKIEFASGENKNTYAFWNYILNNTDGISHKLMAAYSTDNGSSFGTPLFPVSTTDKIEDYAIGTYGTGNIFCAWLNINTDNIGTILFSRSIDSGANFSSAKQLNMANAYSGISMVVDDSGIINVSWIASEPVTGKDAIYHTYSSDFGLNFVEQKQIAVASSSNVEFRKIFSATGHDGKIYRAWWQTDKTDAGHFIARIAISNEDCSCVNISTIAEFTGLDIDNLPDIQLAIDKINNVYSVIVAADNKINIYRSVNGSTSFQQIADTQNLGATGPASFTLDENGRFFFILPLLVEYTETDNAGATVTKTAIEAFLIKSNE
jgi:hypothetical protein